MRYHCFPRMSLMVFLIIVPALVSCSRDGVRDYFRSHGMSYPVDSSGISVPDCRYVDISGEKMAPGEAQGYIEDAVAFARIYFQGRSAESLLEGAEGVVISNPVLYRNPEGSIGLMVRMSGYSAGTPPENYRTEAEAVGTDKQFWRMRDYAYFYIEDDRWLYGGLVTEN